MRSTYTILLVAPSPLIILAAPTNNSPDQSPARSRYYAGQFHPNEDIKRSGTWQWRIGPCQFGGGHRNCAQECLASAMADCVETKGSLGWLGCSTQLSEVLQCWCSCTT